SRFGHNTLIFWHIPFPKFVPDEYVDAIKSIVEGLLGASTLGFHTQEYAQNFMNFIAAYMPEYKVNRQSMEIKSRIELLPKAKQNLAFANHRTFLLQQNLPARNFNTNSTSLLVHPLGIDFEYWAELGESSQSFESDSELSRFCDSNFILSVDRADY